MQITIFRLPDGELQLNVDGVPFAQAVQVDETIIGRLRALGLTLTVTQPPEQHRPDGGPDHVHLHAQH